MSLDSGLSARRKGILKTMWQWNKGKLGKGFKPVLVRFQNPLKFPIVPVNYLTQYSISQLEFLQNQPNRKFQEQV